VRASPDHRPRRAERSTVIDAAMLRREIETALPEFRRAMAEAIRQGDSDLYANLADRYARAHARWERLQPPQVGPQEPQP